MVSFVAKGKLSQCALRAQLKLQSIRRALRRGKLGVGVRSPIDDRALTLPNGARILAAGSFVVRGVRVVSLLKGLLSRPRFRARILNLTKSCKREAVEGGFKAGPFGGGAHDADFDFHGWRKVALTDRGEVLAVE